ncbi:MAG: LacI family DNA-binding transcriptional regulator [Fimbriimonas sp.]
MRRTTIADVAKHAGVGKVTVSYVLNGQSRTARISEETEKKVLRCAEELGYRPNALARMLVTQRSDALAVVFQYGAFFSALSSFTSEAMRGVCAACVESGFDLMLHTKAADDPIHEACALMDGRVDGVLMLRDRDDPAMAEVVAHKFPCVLFFTRSDDPHVPFVDSDNYAGGRMATSHLLELGHQKIGMVIGPAGSVAAGDRFNGYRNALESAGIELRPDYVVSGVGIDPTDFIKLITREDRPTALFVWSDDDAFICMQTAIELGLSIPEDLSIVGYDSSEACERSKPALTSVRQPVFDMAHAATRLLVSLVRGTPVERTRIVFPPDLDVRGSTAPFGDSFNSHRRGHLSHASH